MPHKPVPRRRRTPWGPTDRPKWRPKSGTPDRKEAPTVNGGGVTGEPVPDPDERPWWAELLNLIAVLIVIGWLLTQCEP